MYEIVLTKSAAKDLDKIREPDISRIIYSIEILGAEPRNKNVKKLTNRNSEYRMRVGKYRILFTIEDKSNIVRIARVRLRKDVYK